MARIDNAMVLVQAGADINALNNVSISTQAFFFYSLIYFLTVVWNKITMFISDMHMLRG